MDFARVLTRAVVSLILKPTTCSTTQTSAAVDLADYEGKVLIVVNTTKGTDNDETMIPTVIDCDTSGGCKFFPLRLGNHREWLKERRNKSSAQPWCGYR